ncbi:DUF4283 domain-containing protein [Raphanus sativus]|nr:DUF4283 domain-containing protein [Raphanus sativus]
MEIEQKNNPLPASVTVQETRSENATVQVVVSVENPNLIPPIPSLAVNQPSQTFNASSVAQTHPQITLPSNTSPKTTNPELGKTTSKPRTLVENLRAAADMSLRRLAPATIAPNGRPRIVIPDTVFKKGAEIHQDFIICYFNGKSPPFNQIQSVFNYMWGKGKRLEIHNNPLNHSVIVRIQSSYLRQKILDKNIWYVGESMFHTAQWNSQHSMSTPPLKAIKIWAHLTGVPLDLRYDEGLSLVAGLIGEPKETDEFTKNMVSLSVSHVKVEVDLTLPLPPVVEFERENGEVVEVLVHYPWTPPTCVHCGELGHILRNCLTYTPPAPEKGKEKEKASSSSPSLNPKPVSTSKSSFTPSKASRKNQTKYQPVQKNPLDKASTSDPKPPSTSLLTPAASLSSPPDPPPPPVISNLFSSLDHPPRPSLKRSRSSPILSPPHSSSANPFSVNQTLAFLDSTPFVRPKPPHLPTDPKSSVPLFSFGSLGVPPSEDPPLPSQ